MSRSTPEDHVKFLLSCVKYSNIGKIDFVEVAKECGIVSKGAAAKRYERLARAYSDQFGGSGTTNSQQPPPSRSRQRDDTRQVKTSAKRKRIDEEYDGGYSQGNSGKGIEGKIRAKHKSTNGNPWRFKDGGGEGKHKYEPELPPHIQPSPWGPIQQYQIHSQDQPVLPPSNPHFRPEYVSQMSGWNMPLSYPPQRNQIQNMATSLHQLEHHNDSIMMSQQPEHGPQAWNINNEYSQPNFEQQAQSLPRSNHYIMQCDGDGNNSLVLNPDHDSTLVDLSNRDTIGFIPQVQAFQNLYSVPQMEQLAISGPLEHVEFGANTQSAHPPPTTNHAGGEHPPLNSQTPFRGPSQPNGNLPRQASRSLTADGQAAENMPKDNPQTSSSTHTHQMDAEVNQSCQNPTTSNGQASSQVQFQMTGNSNIEEMPMKDRENNSAHQTTDGTAKQVLDGSSAPVSIIIAD